MVSNQVRPCKSCEATGREGSLVEYCTKLVAELRARSTMVKKILNLDARNFGFSNDVIMQPSVCKSVTTSAPQVCKCDQYNVTISRAQVYSSG